MNASSQIYSGVITSGIENQLASFFERWNTKIFATVLGKSVQMGAQTSIHCVVTDDDVNGKVSDCRIIVTAASPAASVRPWGTLFGFGNEDEPC